MSLSKSKSATIRAMDFSKIKGQENTRITIVGNNVVMLLNKVNHHLLKEGNKIMFKITTTQKKEQIEKIELHNKYIQDKIDKLYFLKNIKKRNVDDEIHELEKMVLETFPVINIFSGIAIIGDIEWNTNSRRKFIFRDDSSSKLIGGTNKNLKEIKKIKLLNIESNTQNNFKIPFSESEQNMVDIYYDKDIIIKTNEGDQIYSNFKLKNQKELDIVLMLEL